MVSMKSKKIVNTKCIPKQNKTIKYSIKKILALIECFEEIETFSLTRETQEKLSIFLKQIMDENKKLKEKNKKLLNKIGKQL